MKNDPECSGRTHALHGATHLVLFVVYLFLMFE
jgi:Ca2+:H+ antiporter